VENKSHKRSDPPQLFLFEVPKHKPKHHEHPCHEKPGPLEQKLLDLEELVMALKEELARAVAGVETQNAAVLAALADLKAIVATQDPALPSAVTDAVARLDAVAAADAAALAPAPAP